MLNLLILLQGEVVKIVSEPKQASFWEWFFWESIGAVVVFLMLYIFFIKNPKINPPRQRRRDEED